METVKPIKDLFNNYRLITTKTRITERGELIKAFTEKLNSERLGTKYPQLTIERVAHILSIYKDTGDLYILLRKCNEAKHWSKCFWWFTLNKNRKE